MNFSFDHTWSQWINTQPKEKKNKTFWKYPPFKLNDRIYFWWEHHTITILCISVRWSSFPVKTTVAYLHFLWIILNQRQNYVRFFLFLALFWYSCYVCFAYYGICFCYGYVNVKKSLNHYIYIFFKSLYSFSKLKNYAEWDWWEHIFLCSMFLLFIACWLDLLTKIFILPHFDKRFTLHGCSFSIKVKYFVTRMCQIEKNF